MAAHGGVDSESGSVEHLAGVLPAQLGDMMQGQHVWVQQCCLAPIPS